MLYTAILVACLTAAPDSCRSHEMDIEAGASPVSAFVEAQSRAADWLLHHPELAQRSLIIRSGRSA